MALKTLLLTAPFTQLNTPYPATAYLKGFLNTINRPSLQVDLGIELILQLFSKQGLKVIFENIANTETNISDNANRIFQLREDYIHTIDPVIRFLQNKNNTLAHLINTRNYLPEANRFNEIGELDTAFGTMGTIDKARYFSTLYIEDIGDIIKESIDPYFGFSRYAEHLGMSASSFNDIYENLSEEHSLIDDILIQLLTEKIDNYQPNVVAISIPFPGNLYASLRCGQYIKENHPETKIIFGGGYPNTELRKISDPRLFEFCDYVCLDDGEAPLQILLQHIEDPKGTPHLKRVFRLENNTVLYDNTSKTLDIPQLAVGTPDYSDLWLDEYLSVIEFPNPMHRLWSDGRWNKMTLAHGCYWGKCTFCDVTLDYIGRYEPINAKTLCDRIEEIIEQTQENGFHFVDEAASPALLRDISIEIIKRKLSVVWWTNIRFEKRFSEDLCRLMAASGCIAISAGLEVASDRLLKLIKKGVSVEQVAQVAQNFTKAGIMVHSYLMYGFPTQTDQETIDSLEMVRQLYKAGVVQSGYWHRFALTAHSPISKAPEEYNVTITGPNFEGFAENDLEFDNYTNNLHEKFGPGLKKALYNYMHNNMIQNHLSEWFEFDIPSPTIDPHFINKCLLQKSTHLNPKARVLWIYNIPQMSISSDTQIFSIFHKNDTIEVDAAEQITWWIYEKLKTIHISIDKKTTLEGFLIAFESETGLERVKLFNAPIWKLLRENGLFII